MELRALHTIDWTLLLDYPIACGALLDFHDDIGESAGLLHCCSVQSSRRNEYLTRLSKVLRTA